MLQNATPLRKSAPGPPNSSDEHVSCTAPATENASLQVLFKCPTPAIVFGNATKLSCFAHFWQGAQSLAPATQNDASTSKSGANMWCFVHFDVEMCFAPQRRTLFEHLETSKSAPNPLVFYTFDSGMCFSPQRRALFSTSQLPKVVRACGVFTYWLGNVLRIPTACAFSTSQLPKWVRTWGVLRIWVRNVLCATTACNFSSLIWPAGSAAAALASLLFDPPGATNHWKKNTVFRDFPTFLRTWIFFLLRLSLFWSSFFFSSLLFSESSHLCFSSVHIVGSLISKLPSNTFKFKRAFKKILFGLWPCKSWVFRSDLPWCSEPFDTSVTLRHTPHMCNTQQHSCAVRHHLLIFTCALHWLR